MTAKGSRERQKLMADLYRDRSMTVRQIADMFGVTPNTVSYARKKHGVPERHPVMAAAKQRKNKA